MKHKVKRRLQKWLFYLVVCALLLVAIPTFFIFSHYHQNFTSTADCAVVFGAAVWRDNIPSHALYDRTMTGIELFKRQQVDCLIFSGGPSTYGDHEASVMRQLALKSGVPDEVIFLDKAGVNTWHTIHNLPDDKSYAMVSNDFHLARIRMLAWQRGLSNVDLQAAEYLHGRYGKEWFFFLREVGGLWWYGICGLFFNSC